MLKLMYITRNPEVALIAEEAGVDRIFIDMEFLGKDIRQGGLDTVKNHHTVSDVANIKSVLSKAEVHVRVNPIHDELSNYPDSKHEIDEVINAGADIVMLPFFKTVDEVSKFLNYVNGRAKTCLLLETPEAADQLDEIVKLPGIDMIHIGLNDMHLALGLKFMFQLLADGSVDKWVNTIKEKGIMFGFGGLASLNGGAVPGKMILKEHYRLGSQMVILSRAFCNTAKIGDICEIRRIFNEGIPEIRALELECMKQGAEYFENNQKETANIIKEFVKTLK